MTKKEVQQRVLQNGKPLKLDKFSWDEKTNTFSSDEDDLVIDFNDIDYCTFKTGSYCIFDTGSDCTFKTGSYCTFDTGSYCTFDTGSDCTFKTGSNCTFDTGSNCIFDTGSDCVVIRRDIYGIIELEKNKKIKLHESNVKGFDIINETDNNKKQELIDKADELINKANELKEEAEKL